MLTEISAIPYLMVSRALVNISDFQAPGMAKRVSGKPYPIATAYITLVTSSPWEGVAYYLLSVSHELWSWGEAWTASGSVCVCVCVFSVASFLLRPRVPAPNQALGG